MTNQSGQQSPPFIHGQESGFGTLDQVPQDPGQLAGYQQIEEDTVRRLPRNRLAGPLRSIPLPLLLIAGVAIPLAFFIWRRRR
jgi:hypothetical protein